MGSVEKDKKNFLRQLEGASKEREAAEEVSFAQYLEMVEADRRLARSAHQYVYDAICSFGVEQDDDGKLIYQLFRTGPNAIFGIDDNIRELMEVLKAGAEGSGPREQVILLMGPPGSGKSTVVTAIKWGLEKYSRTPEGRIFAIADCPQHDDPLKLIPEELRASFQDQFGIEIEGHTCPKCQYHYDGSDWADKVRIKRITFSEQKRVGIGTFWATDPKTQEISELIGSINLKGLASQGVVTHPEAYSFSGEFNKSNRGLMEFGEMLRANEEFLRPLFSLTTERYFKVPGFALVYVDTLILGHTNEANYIENLVKPASAEGLRRRIRVVTFPYTLDASAEEQIYHKQLAKVEKRGVHISPDAYRVAAMWAILTRLTKSNKAELIPKLRLYDGEDPESVFGGRGGVTARELRTEAPREGMTGVPPTYVENTISEMDIHNCLNFFDTLIALKDGLPANVDTREMSAAERERLANLFGLVKDEFDTHAQRVVRRAFVHSFESQAQATFANYLENVKAYSQGKKLKDKVTGQEYEPDEPLMRSLEEKAGISDSQKKEFRQQLLIHRGLIEDDRDSYTSYPQIREAIEKKLYEELGHTIDYIDDDVVKDEERSKKRSAVIERLIDDYGYCPHCASHLIRYVKRLRKK